MLVGGEAELDGQPLELFALYVLRPGHERALSSASGGRLMLMGGEALLDPPLRLLELRLLVARPDQPGQGGLEGAALPADPRRRPGIYPAARGAEDGQLSVTEFRRDCAQHRRDARTSRSPAIRPSPPVILLHGFPESHRTWREVAPRLAGDFFLVMPDQRGFAGSDLPQEVEAYKTDILIDDIFALADALGLEQFALVGHDWGGAIAWGAALRGDPRLTRLGDRQRAASGRSSRRA